MAQGINNHVEGQSNKVNGIGNHVEGLENQVQGNYNHVNGTGLIVSGNYQTVIGKYNRDNSDAIFIIGSGQNGSPLNLLEVSNTNITFKGQALAAPSDIVNSIQQLHISGNGSTAVQQVSSVADGGYAAAFGYETTSSGISSFTTGSYNKAFAANSFVGGLNSEVLEDGSNAFAYGQGVSASGIASAALGIETIASQQASFAANYQTTADQYYSSAFGLGTRTYTGAQMVVGKYNLWSNGLFVVGNGSSKDNGKNAFIVQADGRSTLGADPINNMDAATKQYVDNNSIALLNLTNGEGTLSLQTRGMIKTINSTDEPELFTNLNSISDYTNVTSLEVGKAIGNKGSVAIGNEVLAQGERSAALGSQSLALGDRSFTIGTKNIAYGPNSSAHGLLTVAEGDMSASFGINTHSSGYASFSIGSDTSTFGDYSFSSGIECEASHIASSVFGIHSKTSRDYQFVIGQNNTDNQNALFIVGNGAGIAQDKRSNAFTVNQDGTATIQTAPINDMDIVNKSYVDALEYYKHYLTIRLDGLYYSLALINHNKNVITVDDFTQNCDSAISINIITINDDANIATYNAYSTVYNG